MPTSIRLDAETEVLLERLAGKRRQTKSDVVRDSIALLAEVEKKGAPQPGAYAKVAHLIGSVDSGGQQLSENSGQRVRELLLKKHARRPR